jgi:hypothetical protein
MEYRTLWGGVSVALILRFYSESVETKNRGVDYRQGEVLGDGKLLNRHNSASALTPAPACQQSRQWFAASSTNFFNTRASRPVAINRTANQEFPYAAKPPVCP